MHFLTLHPENWTADNFETLQEVKKIVEYYPAEYNIFRLHRLFKGLIYEAFLKICKQYQRLNLQRMFCAASK